MHFFTGFIGYMLWSEGSKTTDDVVRCARIAVRPSLTWLYNLNSRFNEIGGVNGENAVYAFSRKIIKCM